MGEDKTATVGSLFSGIGGFDLGLERAGWEVRWQVELNPFRQKVLARHWPNVERRSDIQTDTNGLERVDLVCGGSPCQDLSVAGNRAGLAGEQSGLWFEFVRVVAEIRPAWVLFENVPGLLSSNGGRDFEIVVNGLSDLGYGVAWRVLDSQHFGVPQRRRRLYLVGRSGAPCPPEILFEPESCERHPAESRETRAGLTRASLSGIGSGGPDDNDGQAGRIIPEQARTVTSREGLRHDDSAETYVVNARQDPDWEHGRSLPLDAGHPTHAVVSGTVTGAETHNGNSNPIPENYVISNGQGDPNWDYGRSFALDTEAPPAIAIQDARGVRDKAQHGIGITEDGPMYTIDGTSRHAVAYRKQTGAHGPYDGDESWEYTERAAPITSFMPGRTTLVGAAPDPNGVRASTRVPRRLDTPDGPRYAALGDAVTVLVIEWIGRRIMEAHQ